MNNSFQPLSTNELSTITGGGIIDSIKQGVNDAIEWVDREVIQPVKRAIEISFTS